ncbi:MAG: hypothetical protein ABIH41_01650, partial [Nanoarchaeota archaeon]
MEVVLSDNKFGQQSNQIKALMDGFENPEWYLIPELKTDFVNKGFWPFHAMREESMDTHLIVCAQTAGASRRNVYDAFRDAFRALRQHCGDDERVEAIHVPDSLK